MMAFLPTLSLLINSIIASYFNNSHCMFLLYDDFKTFDYSGAVPIVNLKVNQTVDESLVFRSYGCQTFLINHSNSTDIITQLEMQMKLHDDRFNFRKYLIIPAQNQSTESLLQIFDSPLLQYIVNILVVVPIQQEGVVEDCEDRFGISCQELVDYELLTNKYVGTENNSDPQVLDVWGSENASLKNEVDLYPDKITDQQGRTLRCATFTYKPYSILEPIPTLAKGSENSVAHEFAKKLNMSLEYVLDDEEWGIIYDNWTGNGILGNLALDYADVGYGALYTWAHEYGFLDLSKPVVRTGITCLVPAPRLAPGWLLPFFPFSLLMWIGTAISFIIIWVIGTRITSLEIKGYFSNSQSHHNLENKPYKEIYSEILLRTTRIFLVQSLPSTDQVLDIAFKYLFVIHLFTVLTTATYSSGLASVMTLPRYVGAIDTVLDLANSGMHWGATQDAWIFSIMAEERPQYVTLVERFIPTKAENLRAYAKARNFAFSIERLPSGQYAIGSYITEDVVTNLRSMKEDLYWEYCVFMLRKSSPLLDAMDTFLMRLAQSGLIYFWEMKAAQTHMDVRVQNIVGYYTEAADKDNHRGTVQLKWTHVEGTFALLISGYAISIICFAKEILVEKFRKKHNKTRSFLTKP